MPLSDHERQMLEEMERHLFADDPRLARTFESAATPRRDHRRILVGVAGVAVGLALLVLAVALPSVVLGVAAFLVMVAGGVWAATAPVVENGAPGTARRVPAGAARPGTGEDQSAFMRRMEERWERRGGLDHQD